MEDEKKQKGEKCRLRLEEPPACDDIFGIRSYALCWGVYVGVKEKKLDMSSAMKQGWQEARKSCKK